MSDNMWHGIIRWIKRTEKNIIDIKKGQMIMRKVVVFGAGGTGRRVYEMIKTQNEVLYFVDNDEEKWGH